MRAEEYLTILTEQIRCKKARDGIAKELRNHLEEQQVCFQQEGMKETEAEGLAVEEMGDPVEIGVELDRIHRPRMAWGIIFLIGIISVGGCIILDLLQTNFPDAYFLPYGVNRYSFYLVMGFFLMIGICLFDYSQIRHWAKKIAVVLCAALVFGTWMLGIKISGTQAWIRIGRMSLDARQMLFFFLPLYGAILYSYRGQGYGALMKSVIWILAIPAIALIYPSITTAVMLIIALTATLSVAIWKGWFRIARAKVLAVIWGGIFLSPILGSFMIFRFGATYQAERIRTIIDPSLESGYLLRTIRELLADSQFIGSNHMQIEEMLPGSSDYILTYIIAKYGILAAALTVGLIILLLFCLVRLSLRQKNQLGMVMGVGCTAALSIQLLIYILGNTGILLVVNNCPFLSYGCSGIMTTYILLGILLSIFRYENVISDTGLSNGKPTWRVRLVIEK